MNGPVAVPANAVIVSAADTESGLPVTTVSRVVVAASESSGGTTKIEVDVPTIGKGKVAVTVTNASGKSNSVDFTVT